MRKREPEIEDKLQGIAYARAYNKLRSFARSLNWEIRLKYKAGAIEIDHTEDNRAILRYSLGDKELSLALNPHTSEAILTSEAGTYIYPIFDRYIEEGNQMEGIDNALDDVRASIKRVESRPKLIRL